MFKSQSGYGSLPPRRWCKALRRYPHAGHTYGIEPPHTAAKRRCTDSTKPIHVTRKAASIVHAGVRPTSPCTCPCSPRNVRLGGRSPRHRVWPRGRRACHGGVSLERAPPRSVPPQRSPSRSTPGGLLPSPILRRASSPREAVLCRLTPGAGAHRRGCRAALSVREEPWARRGRQRGALGGTLPNWQRSF